MKGVNLETLHSIQFVKDAFPGSVVVDVELSPKEEVCVSVGALE